MIGTIDVKIQAHNPQFPLTTINSFKNSPSNIRLRDVPKSIGNWKITRVYIDVKQPDTTIKTYETKLIGGVYVATIDGFSTAGTIIKGYFVKADGVDENGDNVTGYILGSGDIRILDTDGRTIPQKDLTVVNLLPSKPLSANIGDAVFVNNRLEIYDGNAWRYTDNIPTKVSELSNDAGYIISNDLSNYAHLSSIPTKLSQLSNDSGYITTSEITNKRDIDDLSVYGEELSFHEDEGEDWDYQITGTPSTACTTEFLYSRKLNIIWCTHDYSGYTKGWYWDDSNNFVSNNKNAERLTYHAEDEDEEGEIIYSLNITATRKKVKKVVDTLALSSQLPSIASNTTAGLIKVGDNLTIDADGKLNATGGGSTKQCYIQFDTSGLGGGQSYSWYYNNQKYDVKCRNVGYHWLYIDGLVQNLKMIYNKHVVLPIDGVLSIEYDGYICGNISIDGKDVELEERINTTGHSSIYCQVEECLDSETPILMSDGTTKKISELDFDDKILAMNPETMELEEDEVKYTDSHIIKQATESDIWTFDDGTILKTIKPHQFYNVRLEKMEYIANFQIGDQVLKSDGTKPHLIKHETKRGIVYHNTLYTKKYNNYFANGILTGNRKSVKWGWYWREQNNQI